MFAQLLRKYARRNIIWAVAALCLAINLIAFPLVQKKTRAVAPDHLGALDLRYTYSPDEACRIIDSFGPEGRAIYARSAMILDLIYPIAYTLFFLFILVVLMDKAYPEARRPNWLLFVPVVTFFADLAENTGIVLLIKNHPACPHTLAQMTSLFTSIKWTFVGLTVAAILWLWAKRRKK